MPNRAVLVSGGSGGIGSAVCHALAESGYRPIVGYARNRADAEATARATGGMPLPLDLTHESSIKSAVDEVSDDAADATLLSGVILAASPPPVAVPFGQVSTAEMEAQWRVNVLGPQILISSLVRRVFRRSKRGFVIGVLSDAMGREGEPAGMSMGAYVIGKYGLAGVLALAAHDYPWLHVRSVRPGFTDTDMLRAFDQRFIEQLKTRGAVRPACAVAADIIATLPPVERIGS